MANFGGPFSLGSGEEGTLVSPVLQEIQDNHTHFWVIPNLKLCSEYIFPNLRATTILFKIFICFHIPSQKTLMFGT